MFVILYVYQNVEVTKIKIIYRNVLDEERQLVNSNDRLKYEIEKLRRVEVVDKQAAALGMRELTPDDFVTIETDK
ncbi:MAG: hypothetical protein JW864_07640 [Spirochaetes bacterium]|nr:hypothetical protein [Spirochaetota bacterium]